MDNQHLRILVGLQRFAESLRGPFPLQTLGARLKQLETLVLDHFQDEEAMLQRIQYPHLAAHQAEHESLIELCHELLDQFSSPESPPLVELPERLLVLFDRHIQGVDMDYAHFLAAQAEEDVEELPPMTSEG
jgi:hemerythrin-like metal-binding protein